MARNNETPIRVGLLGAGTVGSQTARLIVEQKDELSARIGRPVELTGVACLDPKETEKFPWIDQSIVTTDTLSVATNSDIVIELIGGTTVPASSCLPPSNPVLPWSPPTRRCWPSTARRSTPPPRPRRRHLLRGRCGGAIPFLRPLRESLVGDKVTSMLGIVNGTTNYILDEMTTKVSSSTTCSRTPRPRLRRSRPDRRHRRLRCCQQGRHHGHPRLPHLRDHRRCVR